MSLSFLAEAHPSALQQLNRCNGERTVLDNARSQCYLYIIIRTKKALNNPDKANLSPGQGGKPRVLM